MNPRRVLFVFGTRPEAIKLAPVIQELAGRPGFEPILCLTAQHRQLLDQVMEEFQLRADHDLDLMRPGQTLAGLTGALVQALDSVVAGRAPDWLVVQGDTTSAFVGALVAFYRGIPVAHVEAGLRTFDLGHPFPEEFNRRAIDLVARVYFAPTERAAENLRREGVPPGKVQVCGNTALDALRCVRMRPYRWIGSPIAEFEQQDGLVLVTTHRRESFGAPVREVCGAIRELATRFPATPFVLPVHANPNVEGPVRTLLGSVPNIHLLPPLDYLALVQLMKKARLVMTDSGGLQEEAPSFGLPILVLRETTERPEAVEAGFACLVGTSHERIVSEGTARLARPVAENFIDRPNPFGDGHASRRIADALASWPGPLPTSRSLKP